MYIVTEMKKTQYNHNVIYMYVHILFHQVETSTLDLSVSLSELLPDTEYLVRAGWTPDVGRCVCVRVCVCVCVCVHTPPP